MPPSSESTGHRHRTPLAECTVGADCEPADRAALSTPPAARAVLQHRNYTASWNDGRLQHGDYYLSFVEFDDQGWFADRGQMDALFALLAELQEEGTEALIHVYAHGWKHNAGACDNNVVCFSRLLERTDLNERFLRQENRRAVVGVYLGWRGLPFNGGPLTNLSFWSRKEAASRVGRGSVIELLARLDDYRDSRQGAETDPSATQLVITGHSFGGLVIYSALAQALIENAAQATYSSAGADHTPATSFGDFVLLVNPAFEGSLYEPLFDAASRRAYSPEQPPVMMIVTSEADRATAWAFPKGRTLGTLFQHSRDGDQKRSIRQAVGHDDRYLTHRLSYRRPDAATRVGAGAGSEPGAGRSGAAKEGCGCPYLSPTHTLELEDLVRLLQALLESVGFTEGGGTPNYGAEVELRPVCRPSAQPGYPYLVVRTDRQVIANHNAIYNERFTDFTQLFLLNHVSGPRSAPLGGAGGDSCSSDE